jgi:hypothetical protein
VVTVLHLMPRPVALKRKSAARINIVLPVADLSTTVPVVAPAPIVTFKKNSRAACHVRFLLLRRPSICLHPNSAKPATDAAHTEPVMCPQLRPMLSRATTSARHGDLFITINQHIIVVVGEGSFVIDEGQDCFRLPLP